VSRKRIVQLLASLVILSYMVLPVQAAPQVNIVPLVQLLLLNPAEVEFVDSAMWDGVNLVPKTDFLTTDEQACYSVEFNVGPTSNFYFKIEWFNGDNFYTQSSDGNSPGGVHITLTNCIKMVGNPTYSPPVGPPPPSAAWKARLSIDGKIIEEQPFTISAP